jgi:acyl-coenzyme A thioesterase PaaI-like protein
LSSTRSKTELNPDPIDLGSVPHCFSFMQGRILDYIEGESLTIGFPVFRHYLNPSGSMQGGFISAAVITSLVPYVIRLRKLPKLP